MSKKGSRKILSDLQKLYPELVTVHRSDNPVADFKKIFNDSDSQFFVTSPSGELTEI
jgi:hypothetical protein